MRLNKKTLHLTAFILASFASLPAHVSAVFEKSDKQAAAEIQRNPDDGEKILDYIVRFTNTTSYQSFAETEVQLMNTVTSLSFMNAQVLKFPSEEDAEAWFAKRKDVQIFVKDGRVRAAAEETPYGIAMVEALDIEYVADSDIKACIIDTGYDLGHVDLPNEPFLTGGGTCSDVPCDWKEDPNRHGTHVAGTMAALTNDQGVVGVVSSGLMPMHIERALNRDGRGSYSEILQAMNNCVDAGAKVVNMSLEGGFTTIYDSYLDDLVNEGTEVLFVAAAGNRGNDSYSYPASADSSLMMSVACVDSASKRCPFSMYNDQVDIAAPGIGVKSTLPMSCKWGPYGPMDGTSMSSPHVAAVAALIWSHHPNASVADVRKALENSAIQPDPYAPGERNDDLGWGIVNAERALELLLQTSPPSISPSPTLNPSSSQQPSFSAAPSSAPSSVCYDSAVDKFFHKGNAGRTSRNCKFLRRKNRTKRKQICERKAPAGSGYLSAKDVCPKTCDNCCVVEIKHLENELENYVKLAEHYKRILELNNIEF